MLTLLLRAFMTQIRVSMVVLCVLSRSSLPILYALPVPPPSAMQADSNNHLMRLLVLSSGVVTTFAGQAGSAGSTNGVGTNARFNGPRGIALDAVGTFAVMVRLGREASHMKGSVESGEAG